MTDAYFSLKIMAKRRQKNTRAFCPNLLMSLWDDKIATNHVRYDEKINFIIADVLGTSLVRRVRQDVNGVVDSRKSGKLRKTTGT